MSISWRRTGAAPLRGTLSAYKPSYEVAETDESSDSSEESSSEESSADESGAEESSSNAAVVAGEVSDAAKLDTGKDENTVTVTNDSQVGSIRVTKTLQSQDNQTLTGDTFHFALSAALCAMKKPA